MNLKQTRYIRRKKRVRSKIFGTGKRPRLSVYKSGTHIYGQVIDDEKGITVVAASDLDLKRADKTTKTEVATLVGEALAKKAVAKKVKKVIFDRNGFMFHGRVKALAEGARKGGLEF